MSEGHFSLLQSQQLRLSPQMLRSMQMLRQPMLDLLQSVQQEVEQNPALEVLDEPLLVSLPTEKTADSGDAEIFEDESLPTGNASPQTFQLSRPESLHEHLLWQLRLEELSALEFQTGRKLISNLDENGFHINDPEKLLQDEERGVFHTMMALIRGFDPIGVCVKDFRESLQLQADMRGNVPECFSRLVAELFNPEDYQNLAHSSIPEPALSEGLSFLRQLNPFPGRQYSTAEVQYVIPDASITVKDGEVVVLPNKRCLPRLGINRFFEKSIREGASDVKKFARQQVTRAREFLQSLSLREHSTELVIEMVAKEQEEFFRKGPDFLQPLTMKKVAETIEMSESTVSRVVNGRYVQTDWGVLLLRYFFSTAGVKQSNRKVLPGTIKEYITEILADESSLSDQKITEYLHEKNITIARRTVAKYRKELGLGKRQKEKKAYGT